MNPFNFFFRISDVLDALVFVLCGLLAAALLVGGPLFLIYRLLVEQRYVTGSLSALLWIAFAAACIRDLWRGRLGGASGLLFTAWLALTLAFKWHA